MGTAASAADRLRTDTSFQPKLIYLAKRNAALSRSEFVDRWRRHGALGMSLPRWRNIARYVHCDVLDPHDATVDIADDYDGIGLIWHRSPAARAAHWADTSSREQMERDELETFAGPVVNSCLLARETVILPPPATRTQSIKLTHFQWTRTRAHAPKLMAVQLSGSAALCQQLRALGAEPHGHVVNEPLPAERGVQWNLSSDCVEELWFEDMDAALRAARFLNTASRAGIDSITVLTNEVLLYEG